MNIYGILSMTITPAGVVSLWDDMNAALRGKEEHDVAFQLSLTAAQIRVVARAESVAKQKRLDAPKKMDTAQSS
jgi:hypothetical protein